MQSNPLEFAEDSARGIVFKIGDLVTWYDFQSGQIKDFGLGVILELRYISLHNRAVEASILCRDGQISIFRIRDISPEEEWND